MDAVTKAILEVIGGVGCDVDLAFTDGRHVVTAVDRKTGERFITQAYNLYLAAVDRSRTFVANRIPAYSVKLDVKHARPKPICDCVRLPAEHVPEEIQFLLDALSPIR